jgi:hypothetical protein
MARFVDGDGGLTQVYIDLYTPITLIDSDVKTMKSFLKSLKYIITEE